MSQTHKPRAHLILDIGLFSMLVILLASIILQLLFAHSRQSNAHFMLSVIHGIAGVSMTVLLVIHLIWHTPWITAQFKALQRGGQRARPSSASSRHKPDEA